MLAQQHNHEHQYISQGSDEWYKQRLGKITASRVHVVMQKGRAKDKPFGETAISYMAELIAERLSGLPGDDFESKTVMYGRSLEAEARDIYCQKTGYDVLPVEFATLPSNENIGASSDGKVYVDSFSGKPFRLLEIKCPFYSRNHVKHIMGTISKDYMYQMQLNMLVHDMPECDFMSYDPRCTGATYCIRTIKREDEICEQLQERCELFLEAMNHMQSNLLQAAND